MYYIDTVHRYVYVCMYRGLCVVFVAALRVPLCSASLRFAFRSAPLRVGRRGALVGGSFRGCCLSALRVGGWFSLLPRYHLRHPTTEESIRRVAKLSATNASSVAAVATSLHPTTGPPFFPLPLYFTLSLANSSERHAHTR